MNQDYISDESQPKEGLVPSLRHRHKHGKPTSLLFVMALGSVTVLPPAPASAQTGLITNPEQARLFGLESLRKAVQNDGGVPLPDNLDYFIKNREAALQLGKALFWDMQIGSDGVQSCASCHFHAGTDNRTKNQLNPNLLAIFDDHEDDISGYYNAGRVLKPVFDTRQPNQTLRREDFPLVKSIQNINRTSNGAVTPAYDNSDDIAGSMGMLFTFFNSVRPGFPFDQGTALKDPVWNINGQANVRRVVPRNTPSVINSVFNKTNFWEGRANPHFNGQNAFGDQDQSAAIVVNLPGSGLAFEQISLDNASLASQALAPPTSFTEMSFGDPSQNNFRSLPEIGKKILSPSLQTGLPLTPLGFQAVHPGDSILGALSKAPYRGLDTTYAALIKKAFAEQYWNSDEPIDTGTIVFNQMEFNFGLFFGLSVALYESTLVADQSYFDQWMESGQFNSGFGRKALAGLNLFVNEGQCVKCHAGPELTKASVRAAEGEKSLIRAMSMAKGSALYDNGFYNISVTPTTDDIGRGGKDDFGKPLSFARQALFTRLGIENIGFPILGNSFIPAKDEDLNAPVCLDRNGNGRCEASEFILSDFQRVAVDGAFKTPGLRNSLLTGPYFHNGGMATLRQVVQFYNRGGNFCSFNLNDMDPAIKPLGLTSDQEEQLVAFLVALTDQRVVHQKAPFDHPELRVPVNGRDINGTRIIKAVGRYGTLGRLQPFLNLNPNDAIYTPAGLCRKE